MAVRLSDGRVQGYEEANEMLEADLGSQEADKPRSRDAWTRVRNRLKAELGEEVFSCWFASMNLEGVDGGTVVLSVPSRFLKSWIATHYRDRLTSLWQAEGGGVRKIEVTVRTAICNNRPESSPSRFVPVQGGRPGASPIVASTIRVEQDAPRRETARNPAGPSVSQPAQASAVLEDCSSPLDPRHTFDTFVEGAANRFALAAARQVGDGPDAGGVKFNPLYIHASVGLGKTHLLQAIAHQLRARHPELRVLYLTAEQFVYRFVHALQTQSAIAFKEALRAIDLLIIDDMQFLNGRHVQQEFCHTVNALIDGARQVVVAADRPPIELEMLDERVRSRLAGGLLVEIAAPDLALRRQIVERRIALAQAHQPAFQVPEDVVDFIARNVTTNGRDLEGAINRLIGHNQLSGLAISLAMAETTLKDLIRAPDNRRVKIEDIQRVVAKHFNVSKPDLLSSRRTRSIVWPRQIAMYLAKVLTPRSLPEIGRRFGGRDHTTVLHAVRKVEEALSNDETLVKEIELLKQRCLEAS